MVVSGDCVGLVSKREVGKRPASSACSQNQYGAHRLALL